VGEDRSDVEGLPSEIKKETREMEKPRSDSKDDARFSK